MFAVGMVRHLRVKSLYLFSGVLLVCFLLAVGIVYCISTIAKTSVDPSARVDYLSMEERKVIIYSLKNTGDMEAKYSVVLRLGDRPPAKKEITVEGRSSYRGRVDIYPEIDRVDTVTFTVFRGDEEKPFYDVLYHIDRS